MVQKFGEKGVALKVGEKAASHLFPLHAPDREDDVLRRVIRVATLSGRVNKYLWARKFLLKTIERHVIALQQVLFRKYICNL